MFVYFFFQNTIEKLKKIFFSLLRQDSKTKFVQNPAKNQSANASDSSSLRPKTTNQQSFPTNKTNSTNVNNTNGTNANPYINNANSRINSSDLNQTIESVHNEMLTSKNILNNNHDPFNSQSLNELIPANLPTSDSGLNEYTVKRIIKWLEDIEKCSNKIKPPAQLTWSNSRAEKLQSNVDSSRNFNGEYCLSDYDSLDDQIIEYNRVVDKTFHIVHDED